MKVYELSECMNCKSYGDSIALDKEVHSLYIGDILSRVMSRTSDRQAWLTVQTHLNAVAVALFKNLSCIVILEDVAIPQETLDKAFEEHIAILSTNLSAYEFVTRFNELID